MKTLPPEHLAASLNGIILTCLGGPGGDPDRCHMQAAAIAFTLLRLMDLPIDREEVTECGLRNKPYRPGTRDEESGNIHGIDFLEEAGMPE